MFIVKTVRRRGFKSHRFHLINLKELIFLLTISRDIAYRRNQRKHAINRKGRIIRTSFGTELENFRNSNQKGHVSGKLDKGKVHCSCRMCRYEKPHKIEKDFVKAKHKDMIKEIDLHANYENTEEEIDLHKNIGKEIDLYV